MYRRTAIAVLFLQALLLAAPQQNPSDASSQPVVLKATSRAVQLDVFVNDSSGRPVHGLQKNDFVVTDNGHVRVLEIFTGEIGGNQRALSQATAATRPRNVYSNRLGMRGSPIVTAIVIDAVPRPDGLQRNGGLLASTPTKPEFWFSLVRWQAISAINRMEPGQVMAIYAACPDLRTIQDFTSDPDRLSASLNAFVPPRLPDTTRQKQELQRIDTLVLPMLSVLRDVAGRISGASGRKSVVWISQAYGTELNPSAVSAATDLAIAGFNDANVPLYAVDTRFSPTCQPPVNFPADIPMGGRVQQSGVVTLTCSQPPDISDEWMEYLANATGGRAFSGGKVTGIEWRDAQVRTTTLELHRQGGGGIISEALRFAVDDFRYAYELGFYISESELDGTTHMLSVTVPAKPKFGLRYRRGYSASASATATPAVQELAGPDSNQESASPLNPDEVGIDATIDTVANTNKELRLSLALAPETVTATRDGVVVLDATFTQTDGSGKQLAKVQETVPVPSPATPTEMVRYARTMRRINGAVLLRIRIRDQATNRVGSITIPIEKQ